ncbi:MBL fold metallo-hydrolase, partial [Clostridium sp.]|uniref:MBL fold metallo-hydrolase n=1 Tax=Clostridium sp. TaxID=1506 RepID=UPI00290BD650
MSKFFSENVTEHIIRIVSPCQVCMYLIVGKRRAVLLDTGFGLGSLKSYVKTLTSLPYDVVVSHGHLDHAGGAGEFKEVFLK